MLNLNRVFIQLNPILADMQLRQYGAGVSVLRDINYLKATHQEHAKLTVRATC